MMKKIIYVLIISLILFSCNDPTKDAVDPASFVTIKGQDLIKPNGEKLFIKGTNLGNWLNPEGYMFGFSKASSPTFINQMFCEMVGPDYVADFWSKFKNTYITKEDIKFIKETGSNLIRLPFHYKLFTDEDYMGLTSNQDGFARIDSIVSWCKEYNLYLILDMHDAPGGQTGDNIDDSYGYPWLMESEKSQALFCEIWRKIADYYKNETIILGYEPINEPIATYFENEVELNQKLEPLYKRVTASIREVDANHIILLGGSQWNGNFKPFKDSKFDDKIMYTCHRYGGEPTSEAIANFIQFRDSVNLPMYMGEIGHNTDEWMEQFCETMIANNIGYTFWPYKKVDNSCFAGIKRPENWDVVVAFSEADRSTFHNVRAARPNQEIAKKALTDFLENAEFKNCIIQESYIKALKLKD